MESNITESVCICIPTYRKPPIATFENYPTTNFHKIIVADPSVYEHHLEFYRGCTIAKGAPGICAQVARCYSAAAEAGFPWYFRLDDDLPPKIFIHKEKGFIHIEEVITECYKCALETKTTLAGVQNSSNRYWMGEGYGRTYGLVTGGAHICHSSTTPEQFIDPTLTHYEDVYRSLSHRKRDGAVGRVRHIGIKKASCTDSARMDDSPDRAETIRRICAAFPGMIECNGTKIVNQYDIIANWKFLRGPNYGMQSGEWASDPHV